MTYPPPGETPEPFQPPPYQPPQPPYDPTAAGPDPFAQPDPYGAQPPYSAEPYSGQPYSAQPYSGQPAQPYGDPYGVQPHGPGYGGARRTNGLAIASLVCSLVGLFTCIGAPIGVVLGHVAKGQLKTSGEDGDGLATAGLITGYIVSVLYLGACGLSLAGSMLSSYNN
jgi:hypothetical protein